jgi:hypothetical protein
MRIVSTAFVVVCVLSGCLRSLRADQSAEQRSVPAAESTVANYCAGCHDGVMRSPTGVLLDQFDTARMSENADAWTRAYRQVQAGTMPPVGAPRPDRPASGRLLAAIESGLGATAAPTADANSREIAARLALLLWNGEPDASLLEDAQRDRLTDAATLERHVRRMLDDGRASAFVTRFFFPWLRLDQLARAEPDKAHFPEYDATLRDAMQRETELFILSQLREDRDPIELWSADYTFLNEQLARFYEVAGVAGAQFRRVTLSAPERAGLLGHASVLMATSRHGNEAPPYTSPATRALWIRTRFLGAAAPQPFPNAQPVKPELPITPQTRALPAQPCINCHQNFFPLGYALENFDAIGRWRTRDEAGPVDASGTFVDGTPTNGVVQLRNVLLQRPDAFRTTVTEKLLLYAAGQPAHDSRVSPQTLVRARQILRGMNTARWSSIVTAIVRSKPQPGA